MQEQRNNCRHQNRRARENNQQKARGKVGVGAGIVAVFKAEHGCRHTAHMHSKNIDHLSRFAKAVETTIFVKNAPSYAGIGFGGEGHTTFTIAGPTGEGITSARSFTRQRRCVMADSFRII